MIDVCLYQREKRVCSKVKRSFKPSDLMCRNPRPETRGTPAGAGELLRGWQHLRRHRGPRGQLQAEHARPQRRLRYKSVFILLYACWVSVWSSCSCFRIGPTLSFLFTFMSNRKTHRKQRSFIIRQRNTIFFNIYIYIFFFTMLSHQVIDGHCEFFWFGVGYSSFPARPLDTDTFELVSHINKAVVLCLVCSQENVSWDPQDG